MVRARVEPATRARLVVQLPAHCPLSRTSHDIWHATLAGPTPHGARRGLLPPLWPYTPVCCVSLCACNSVEAAMPPWLLQRCFWGAWGPGPSAVGLQAVALLPRCVCTVGGVAECGCEGGGGCQGSISQSCAKQQNNHTQIMIRRERLRPHTMLASLYQAPLFLVIANVHAVSIISALCACSVMGNACAPGMQQPRAGREYGSCGRGIGFRAATGPGPEPVDQGLQYLVRAVLEQ